MPRCSSFVFSRDLPLAEDGRYGQFCCGNRRAQIEIQKSGMTFKIDLGGIYDSDIVDDAGQIRIAEQANSKERLSVSWKNATFIGWHWLLGEVHVKLRPELQSQGSLLAQTVQQPGLLPALNENSFFFDIEIPRLRRRYFNRAPLINSAQVTAIPPINSLYKLSHPVRFENPENGRDWVDITKCWVLIPDQKFVNIDVVSIVRSSGGFAVEATLENTSPYRFAIAYWFTNTDEPDVVSYSPSMGYSFLGRNKKTIHFTMEFMQEPADPVVQIGAALITNPIGNDPNRASGTQVAAFNIAAREAFLAGAAL